MNNYPIISSMVQAITVLTVLKMMTKAQTSCGSGSLNGKLLYERLPNIQLQGFDDDIVRDTSPPFMVLEKCQDLCLRDRTPNNIVRTCTSFDFQPGSRIAVYTGGTDYEESTCYLTSESARPEGIGILMMVPNSVHFTEVCITSSRPERECPNRRYVFERHPRKKLKLPAPDTKEIIVSNRTECENKCLNEFSFVCRSATFDSTARTCSLSRYTRRTHPELLVDDAGSDYLENTCLSAERRCDGLAVFIKEENKRLGGPFEVDMFTNITLDDCQTLCIKAEKYLCRSIEYDEMTRQCTLSEEDSISQKDDIGVANSESHNFYDFACLDSPRGSEYPDNSVTSHLFSGKKPDTAFQRYRNSRLGGEHHSEISGRTLSECLDECLRQPSFQCRSAEYSDRYRTCRLTRYNQRDGMRIIYDADYDYYENLMLGDNDSSQRPIDVNRPYENTPPEPGHYGNKQPEYPDQDVYHPLQPNRFFPPGNTYDDPYHKKRPPYNSQDNGEGGYYNYPYNSNSQRGRPGLPYKPDKYPNYLPENNRYYPPPYHSNKYYPPNVYKHRYPYEDKYGDVYPYRRGNKNGERYGDYDGLSKNYFPYDGYRNQYNRNPYENSNVIRSRYGSPNHNLYTDRYYPYKDEGRRYGHDNQFDDQFKNFGNRWPYVPDKRPRPENPYIQPFVDRRRPMSPGPDGPIYDNRPYSLKCDNEKDLFKQMGYRQRMKKDFVRKVSFARSLRECELECINTREFGCLSFNYRDVLPEERHEGYNIKRSNCELSDRDSRDMELDNVPYLDKKDNYNYFERTAKTEDDCLDVSQVCNEDGMEFTLKTPGGFYGKIYTYGNYDRCFFRGNGGTLNVLRISAAQGFPECGTQRYGDIMTNIVVVQFSDFVQTRKDKRFNLTCLFKGPGEAIVSSGFIGAGSGSPIPIEYLPAENTLGSKVRLMILYQGRPTTTIAVGDPLTFRLEAQDNYGSVPDIFATNVIARDPYTGRSVQLIDRFGCPVDSYVFPELDKGRNSDSLEARFNAFKIPESNFLVFEATVRTCREECQPAYCQVGIGRTEPSFGRKRRDVSTFTEENITNQINESLPFNSNISTELTNQISNSDKLKPTDYVLQDTLDDNNNNIRKTNEDGEFVREMIEVFDSREELQQEAQRTDNLEEKVCLTTASYHGMIGTVIFLSAVLLTICLCCGIFYRRYWANIEHHTMLDRRKSISSYKENIREHGLANISMIPSKLRNPFLNSITNFHTTNHSDEFNHGFVDTTSKGLFEDPSEPIYTDPSLFERSRSLRSIAISAKKKNRMEK
ncbi:unnamed protein product [Diabrotica balteata]|uniref:No mechanoreceptor potential A n=1 Tax=Diabrotica balteata TaxID=107213 RepID=A0A9N9X889_DIABA|nr:unnamed protein product [Diabrotica balteata]